MKVISGEKALSEFREHWTGEKMLNLIKAHNGRLRIDWEIGVGKSYCLDDTMAVAIKSGQYDLVVALFPTRRLINERPWIRNPPEGISIVNLKPRPRERCGSSNDQLWQKYERNCLGALGRIQLCGHCSYRRSNCYWPRQFGKELKGTKVIFGTQAHLERSPTFIRQLFSWTGAERTLVMLDESNFILKTFHRHIYKPDLERFVEVLKSITGRNYKRITKKWLYLLELLIIAPREDLRCREWNMPFIPHDWAISVQSRGYDNFGGDFKFLAFDLQHFGFSPIDSREKNNRGDLLFSAKPFLPGNFIIFSGTSNHEFSEFRFGQEFESPFTDYLFDHPDTTWYNLASRIGMKKYFSRNSSQILDLFAGLAAKRLAEGRRVLFIAKKYFVPLCVRGIEKRLLEAGLLDISVVSSGFNSANLEDWDVIPLINYGMIGTNLFREFDCAYCLTGYYVSEKEVNHILQDVLASDMHIPIRIETTKEYPQRRKAGVVHNQHRYYDVHRLAQLALDQQEMDVVLQAVGRVRPYTKPREIITFQCAKHPKLNYTQEFINIEEARKFFGIESARERTKKLTISNILTAKKKGLKQKEAAAKLGYGLRTVKRYWNSEKGATNPL